MNPDACDKHYNEKKQLGKTFVAINGTNTVKALGYYTVNMAQIIFKNLPDIQKKGLPRYPIPAMRIGKLAVHCKFQGQHIGEKLLRDALLRAVKISSYVAIHFIIIDAINENAKQFYIKYGFVPLNSNSLTLIISLKTVKKSYAEYLKLITR